MRVGLGVRERSGCWHHGLAARNTAEGAAHHEQVAAGFDGHVVHDVVAWAAPLFTPLDLAAQTQTRQKHVAVPGKLGRLTCQVGVARDVELAASEHHGDGQTELAGGVLTQPGACSRRLNLGHKRVVVPGDGAATKLSARDAEHIGVGLGVGSDCEDILPFARAEVGCQRARQGRRDTKQDRIVEASRKTLTKTRAAARARDKKSPLGARINALGVCPAVVGQATSRF